MVPVDQRRRRAEGRSRGDHRVDQADSARAIEHPPLACLRVDRNNRYRLRGPRLYRKLRGHRLSPGLQIRGRQEACFRAIFPKRLRMASRLPPAAFASAHSRRMLGQSGGGGEGRLAIGLNCCSKSSLRSVPFARCRATRAPAEVPMNRSESRRSTPAEAMPASSPLSHALAAKLPPARTTARLVAFPMSSILPQPTPRARTIRPPFRPVSDLRRCVRPGLADDAVAAAALRRVEVLVGALDERRRAARFAGCNCVTPRLIVNGG